MGLSRVQEGWMPRGPLIRGLITLVYIALASALFGAVLMDVHYAWALRTNLTAEQVRPIFAAVSDSAPLMLLMLLTLLTGAGAIAANWASSRARWLFIASVGLLVAGPFLIPMLMPRVRTGVEANPAGTLLRLGMHALIVALAVTGSRLRHRHTTH
jgi:hypothetical protein